MQSSAVNLSLFSYETLVHALAGSIILLCGCRILQGSVTAMTVFYPLDIIRSRIQLEDKETKNTWALMTELVKKEGIETLYRGIFPVLKTFWTSNFVYFYTFHGLKILSGDEKAQNAAKDLLLATIAGVVNVLTTTPLWVVSTRLKMKGIDNQHTVNYKSLVDGLIKIKKEEGIQTLWSGTVPSLFLVSNPAIQFMVYESLKRQLCKLFPNKNFGTSDFFLIGAISKAVATIVTYPLQLIQTKLRHGHNYSDLAKNVGAKNMAVYIMKKYGVKGLFKGLEVKILQTVLMAALMFATYEKITSFIFRIMYSKHK